MDCEMCYTTLGLQLTRVTVINMDLKSVFESIVKPSHTIVDYNTRYVCKLPQDPSSRDAGFIAQACMSVGRDFR